MTPPLISVFVQVMLFLLPASLGSYWLIKSAPVRAESRLQAVLQQTVTALQARVGALETSLADERAARGALEQRVLDLTREHQSALNTRAAIISSLEQSLTEAHGRIAAIQDDQMARTSAIAESARKTARQGTTPAPRKPKSS